MSSNDRRLRYERNLGRIIDVYLDCKYDLSRHDVRHIRAAARNDTFSIYHDDVTGDSALVTWANVSDYMLYNLSAGMLEFRFMGDYNDGDNALITKLVATKYSAGLFKELLRNAGPKKFLFLKRGAGLVIVETADGIFRLMGYSPPSLKRPKF